MPVAAAVPVPVPSTKALPNRLAGGLVTAGGAIAVIGCFMPWLSASAFGGTVTKDGISNPDGQILAGLAVVSTLLGVLMLARRISLVVPVVLLLTAAIGMWVVVIDYQDLNGRVQGLSSTTLIVAQIGPGIYAAGLGVIIWVIGALAGFRREPAAKRVVPLGPYVPAADSVVGQLHRLLALRDSGGLTEDEFAAERAKLLDT
jgi:hypothetical protein